MSTIQEYTQMVRELFPANAEISVTVEEFEEETTLGFSVTVQEDPDNVVCLSPRKLVKVREKMKATYFFIYPRPTVSPDKIRIYIHAVIYHDHD